MLSPINVSGHFNPAAKRSRKVTLASMGIYFPVVCILQHPRQDDETVAGSRLASVQHRIHDLVNKRMGPYQSQIQSRRCAPSKIEWIGQTGVG